MSGEPYVSGYYMSPIDGHDHFTRQDREECALCHTADKLAMAEARVTAYDDELTHIAFALAGEQTGTVDLGNIFDAIRDTIAERDQWKLVAETMERTRDDIRGDRDRLREDVRRLEENGETIENAYRDEVEHYRQDLNHAAAEVVALRGAVEDAVRVLGAEDQDYDEWTRILAKMRKVLDRWGARMEMPEMVRIIDDADVHRRRLGVVMETDGDRLAVWIGGHADDYRHWLDRSQVEPVEGEWQTAPEGGMLFYEQRATN